ncbi:MAG: CDP-diacylglycerol--serine O-phosphatidyltransferase [Acidobacteria bacterium]|nr:CDP-diacylglycerol--serine O-phosphatidyltransferase [Acidobacteriota bacterium]MCA1610191.1 CDP-diacylglycerol--serine O-phosphatidyltransferase [Acidobacteriota bacterium]
MSDTPLDPEATEVLRPRRRRLSRERLSRGLFVLPTLFTVGNLFCGYLSLWSSINGTFERAALLIILAAILDMLDGRIARLTNSASEFGEEYDSLADLVSFGVAPAILVYSWGLADFHRLGLAVSFFFVVCGSMRLARFNIQTKIADKKYFVGLPIPAAAGTVCTLVLATPEPLVDRVWMTGVLIVTFLLSYLMISTIKYRSFKDLDLRRRRPLWVLPAIALFFMAIAYRAYPTLLALAALFAVSGPIAKIWGFVRRRRKTVER